jgi:hypothetical protein
LCSAQILKLFVAKTSALNIISESGLAREMADIEEIVDALLARIQPLVQGGPGWVPSKSFPAKALSSAAAVDIDKQGVDAAARFFEIFQRLDADVVRRRDVWRCVYEIVFAVGTMILFLGKILDWRLSTKVGPSPRP